MIKTRAKNSGFTLIELMLVLVILTTLTTIAVQSLDNVQDQAHYDATKRTLTEIESASIGPADARDSSGASSVTGFVADMGRLPKAVDHDSDSATPLQPAELWMNPYATSFAIRTADASNLPPADALLADIDVKVPCGWRGPYLRMPIGSNALNDGWGRPFQLLKSNRKDQCAANEIIEIIRSLGTNNAEDLSATNDYNEDLYLNLVTNAIATYPSVSASNQVMTTFTVTLKKSDGSGPTVPANVALRMFGPNPDTGLVKVEVVAPPVSVTAGDPIVYTVTTTIGTHVFRAYESGTQKTVPLTITVNKFAPTNIDLIWKGS